MFMPLFLGSVTVIITMMIQIFAVVLVLQYLFALISGTDTRYSATGKTVYAIGLVMVILFVGHLVQMSIWAVLFMLIGQFSDYMTAFYHSMVNFASLGYGDIVMSKPWRLLGAIESSIGVLMFGVSAGAMLSIMNYLLKHDIRIRNHKAEIQKN